MSENILEVKHLGKDFWQQSGFAGYRFFRKSG